MGQVKVSSWWLFTNVLLAILASAPGLTAVAGESATDAHPNVVLIYVDDLGYGSLDCYGANWVDTPNIDALAEQGMRFTQAYTPTSACSPSRYSLLTGEYSWRSELGPHVIANQPLAVDHDRFTLPDVFKQAGYHTAGFGKWNLGLGHERHTDFSEPLRLGPNQLGFDYYFGIPVMPGYPPQIYFENENVVNPDPTQPVEMDYSGQGPPEMIGGFQARFLLRDMGPSIAQRVCDHIREHADERFFIQYSMPEVHTPFVPHPRFKGRSGAGEYGDYILQMDWAVGQVMETLKSQGIADDTMVIFTSDNGGISSQHGRLPEHFNHAINGKLRGDKGDLYEGGLRIPFIVRWPGRTPKGTKTAQPLQFNDLVKTFASLLDVRVPAGMARDSHDLHQALTGATDLASTRFLVFQGRSGFLALRQGPWKYIDTRGNGDVRRGVNKATYQGDGANAQLYNLAKDPGEQNNLVNRKPQIAARFRNRHRELVEAHQPTGVPDNSITDSASPVQGPDLKGKPLAEYLLSGDAPGQRENPTRQAASVVGSPMTEQGDVDGQQGLTNFKASWLMIKRNALDTDLDNAQNSIVFLIKADAPDKLLALNGLRLQLGRVDPGSPPWRWHIFVNGNPVQSIPFTTASGLSNKTFRVALNQVRPQHEHRVRIEFANKNPGGPNHTLRLKSVTAVGAVRDRADVSGVHPDEEAAQADRPLMLANYYLWYHDNQPAGEGWGNWTQEKTQQLLDRSEIKPLAAKKRGEPALTPSVYPLAGVYDSGNQRVVRWHMRCAQNAGLDAFLVSWWGRFKGRKRTFERSVLPAAEQTGFKIALLDERAQFHHDLEQYKKRLADFLGKYKTSPAYLHIDERPVIYLYQTGPGQLKPDGFRELRSYVEDRIGPVYWIMDKIAHDREAKRAGRTAAVKHIPKPWRAIDGIDAFGFYGTFSNYRAHKYSQLAGRYAFYARQAKNAGKAHLLPVHPGHDNRRQRDPGQGYHMPRRGGQTFKDYLRAASETDPEFIMVTSFNEWPETTIIEPSVSWADPYQYLRIVARWQGRRFDRPAPIPELVNQ
jgi:arylsulfatase A-like enzyme